MEKKTKKKIKVQKTEDVQEKEKRGMRWRERNK